MIIDSTADIFLRFGAATLVGGLIGLNRELSRKPAGLRTHALVALGAAVATAMVGWGADSTDAAHLDAFSRTVQGIITGIGFLGAGVILQAKDGQTVTGLTTAASIWLAACLGAACGAGAWMISFAATVLVLLILVLGVPLESWVLRRFEAPPDEPEK